VAGAIVQYLVRVLFTFKYHKAIQRSGPLYGAILITLAFYFIMINGSGISMLKETPFGPVSMLLWIRHYFWLVLLLSVLFWTLFLRTLKKFRVDVLKTIMLIGVFVLALSMASNEMVNYAGVSLTSLASFNEWFASGVDALHFRVDFLTKNVRTPDIVLGIVGLVLVGVDLRTAKVLVLSGQTCHVLTTDDLLQVIDSHVDGQEKEET